MAMTGRAIAAALTVLLAPAFPTLAADLPRGDPEDAGMSSERLERVRTEMNRLVESGEFPGLTAMIARRILPVPVYPVQRTAPDLVMAEVGQPRLAPRLGAERGGR